MILNLCVKKPKSWVDYKLSRPIEIENDTVNFHPTILLEEVMHLSKKERKLVKATTRTFLMTAVSFLLLSSKSMAATLTTSTNQSIPVSGVGLPPELMELMTGLLVITIGMGILLSAILLASAGIMRMMGKKRRKEAEEWTVDIIKGFVQVLLSAPVIFLIYYLASMMLKGSGWFVSPF